jgi:hypothetical protein
MPLGGGIALPELKLIRILQFISQENGTAKLTPG